MSHQQGETKVFDDNYHLNIFEFKSDTILNESFDNSIDISGNLKNLNKDLTTILKKFDSIKKDYAKVVAIKNKLETKTKMKTITNNNSYIKPRYISNELCIFLKVDIGTMMGKNIVVSMINQYIVLNNLRDSRDRRIILPNDALRKILNIDNTVVLSYFNLQQFLRHHYTIPAI